MADYVEEDAYSVRSAGSNDASKRSLKFSGKTGEM
jgi:hypothetical protein